jgi:hypothetical protein
LRGHDEERVQALDGITRTTPASGRRGAAEDLVEVRHQRLHVGALDREEADRVAREEVDVEELDGVDEVLDLALVPAMTTRLRTSSTRIGLSARRARAASPSRARRRTSAAPRSREARGIGVPTARAAARPIRAPRRSARSCTPLLDHHRRVVLPQQHLERGQQVAHRDRLHGAEVTRR